MTESASTSVPDQGPMIKGVSGFLIGLSIIAVAIRFASRKYSKSELWWDDWLCLAALPVVIVVNVLPIIATYHGLGKHIQDASWDAFEYIQLLFFLDLLLGPVAITLIKASVILFYRRTFRSVNKSFSIFTWTILGVLGAWCIAMFLVTIFTCEPIAAQWNPVVHGSCLNAQKFFLGQTSSNVILDFVILLTPVPFLLKLRVPKSKKFSLLVVFALGYFVPVIAIMRLITANEVFDLAVRHENDPNVVLDLTWNYVDAEVWTFAEPAAGLISCSIPASAYLFGRALKTLGIISTRRSSERLTRSPGQTHTTRVNHRNPAGGSFARLREDQEDPINSFPLNNTAISAGNRTGDNSDRSQEEPLEQIRIIDRVDLTYEPAEKV